MIAIQLSRPVMRYGPRILMMLATSGHAFFIGIACDHPLESNPFVNPKKLAGLQGIATPIRVRPREGWGT